VATCDDSEIGATCFGCLVSQPTDPTWGPLIQYDGIWELNLGGCFGLKGASAACEAATQEQTECENASCDKSCANTTSQTKYDNCVSSADTEYCASYVSAANNCASTSIQTACEGGNANSATFQTAFMATAAIFCQ
jgi:hypothetical protein